MEIKEMQDFLKIPSELMERLMNLTLRYFEDRSRGSCTYLSLSLSVYIDASFKSNSEFHDTYTYI